MGIFRDIFGPHISGPRAEALPAIGRLSREDMEAALTSKCGLSRSQAVDVCHTLFDAHEGFIATAVREGKDVLLVGLGKFTRRERSAGQVRSPATGDVIQVPARNHLAFKPSPKQRWEA